jgi:enediyne biosynthesis protein E4
MHRRSLLRLLLGLGILNPISALDSTHRGFDDVAAASGVRFTHVAGKTSEKYLPESMGAGVAVLDYNSDGFLDLFFVNGAALRNPMPAGVKPEKSDPRYWNRLFRNQGDGTFTDVTLTSGLRGEGYGMGAAVGDFNNDGLPDLYVTSLGQNHLYRNMGDGGFSDVTEKAGVGAAGWSAGACFADYDRDGYLDLIVVRYLDWDFSRNPYCGDRRPGYRSYCHPDQFKPVTHLVYHGNGDGTFTDVSKKCGIGTAPAKGLGIAINDFDRDGWLVNPVGTRSNRDGIGARIRVVVESGAEQYGFVSSAASYASANDKRTHFGLGRDVRVRLVEITWPSGSVQRLENVEADQVLTVKEPL